MKCWIIFKSMMIIKKIEIKVEAEVIVTEKKIRKEGVGVEAEVDVEVEAQIIINLKKIMNNKTQEIIIMIMNMALKDIQN